MSFDSVCDALGIAAEMLRRRLGGLALRHGSAGWEGPRHLRLHGLSRTQHMTANPVREKPSARSRNGDYLIDIANASQQDLF